MLIAIYLTSIPLLSQPKEATSIIATWDHHVFMGTADGISDIAQEPWDKLLSMPGVAYHKWLTTDLGQDIATVDEQGNLWLLLPPQLLCYHQIRKNWRIFIMPQELQEDIFSIESWRGDIWLSSRQALWRFQVAQQWWEQFQYPGECSGGILKKCPQNFLWVNGLYLFNGQYWRAMPEIPISLVFWTKSSQCFTWDQHNAPWLATVQGIYFYDIAKTCWRVAPGKAFQRAYSIGYFEGKIWATEYSDGLYYFNDNEWQKVTMPQNDNLSYVYNINTSKDTLWVDTYFGIYSFNGFHWESHTEEPKFQTSTTWSLLLVIILLSIGILLFIGPLLFPRKRY